MNVILCGLPMSGKTTVGKMLAKKLKWHFVDSDTMIEDAYMLLTKQKKTCREIFTEIGEPAFRELESQQLQLLKGRKNTVIALAGGALNDKENIELLRKLGWLIYLQTDPKLLWERVHLRGIPAYLNAQNPEEDFVRLADKRMPIYESAAEIILEINDFSAEKVVDGLYNLIKEDNKHGK